jgi:hypothetical protein
MGFFDNVKDIVLGDPRRTAIALGAGAAVIFCTAMLMQTSGCSLNDIPGNVKRDETALDVHTASGTGSDSVIDKASIPEPAQTSSQVAKGDIVAAVANHLNSGFSGHTVENAELIGNQVMMDQAGSKDVTLFSYRVTFEDGSSLGLVGSATSSSDVRVYDELSSISDGSGNVVSVETGSKSGRAADMEM